MHNRSSFAAAMESLEVRLLRSASDFDPAFGIAGRADGPHVEDLAYAQIELLADGKVLVAGTGRDAATGNRGMLVTRLNLDGSVDKSFGEHPGWTVIAGHDSESAQSYGSVWELTVTTDGAIVGIGEVNREEQVNGYHYQPAIVRLHADGTRDTAFGEAGLLRIDDTVLDGSVLALPDGTFLVRESATSELHRLDARGQIDPAFVERNNLPSHPPNSNTADRLTPLVSTIDQHIVVLRTGVADPSFTLGRLNMDGALDSTFGESGFAQFNPLFDTEVQLNQTLSDRAGRILLITQQGLRSIVSRLLPDGSIDRSYGDNGHTILNPYYERDASDYRDYTLYQGLATLTRRDELVTTWGSEQHGTEMVALDAAGRVRSQAAAPALYSFDNRDIAVRPDGRIVTVTSIDVRQLDGLLLRRAGIFRDGPTIVVNGSATSDSVSVIRRGGAFRVQVNDLVRKFEVSTVKSFRILGTDGDDIIDAPGAIRATISGGAGNDKIAGGPFADSLFGDSGDDTIDGGLGDDRIIGDQGIDTVSYAGRTQRVFALLSQPKGFFVGGRGGQVGESDRIVQCEKMIGGLGDDVLSLNESGGICFGPYEKIQSCQIEAGPGNDRIRVIFPYDRPRPYARIYGGDGIDTLVLEPSDPRNVNIDIEYVVGR